MDKHCTDSVMKQVWFCLLRDAKSAVELPISDLYGNYLRIGDIRSYRERSWFKDFYGGDPYVVKWILQLEGLFKRYRFEADPYSDTELEMLAARKFSSDQVRISGPLSLRPDDLDIIRDARSYVSKVLGTYDEEEHFALCKLSNRANTKISYRDSYLDTKIDVLSGTPGQHVWFEKYLETDAILHRCVHEQRHRGDRLLWTHASALNLAKVPKSWKAFRTMLPNTVVGAFYSNGIGEMLRKRLLDAGQDIRFLQRKHRYLARQFSRTRSHVTADLSSASDSFNREMLMRLIPSKWYHAIVYGLPRHYIDGSTTYSLQSVMTMGMGHTFPLQTLLFYSLLRAVQRRTKVRGLISVYGDDLIYPRTMHAAVCDFFSRFNLVLNSDKTFVTSHFRESCGGDFYRGVDVRPFCPEGTYRRLSRRPYTAFLYKLYNGLLARWNESEVPQTLHYLLTEIVNNSSVVHQVPPSYPSDAGIICGSPRKPGMIPWSPVKWNPVTQQISFVYLSWVSEKRMLQYQRVYYWDTMRHASCLDKTSDAYCATQSPIAWCYRRLDGKRRLIPYEPMRGRTFLLSQTGQTSIWP